jgi:hypothetical protein
MPALQRGGMPSVAPCQALSHTAAHDLSRGHQAFPASPPSRGTSLGRRGVRLRRGLRAGLGPRRAAWGQSEAAAEESEPRPAKHLAREHLQAIAGPCDRSLTQGRVIPAWTAA